MTLYQATYPCGHLIQLCEHSVKNGQPTKKKCPVCHTRMKYPIFWCAGCKGREAWKLFEPPLPEPPGTLHIISAYVIEHEAVAGPETKLQQQGTANE